MDPAKNFAKGTLSASIDETDTSLTVESGQGARFPASGFNAVIWNATDYPDPSDDPDVEIVRVTAKSVDTLTITRAQEGTAATPHDVLGKTYQIIAPLTAKVINDLHTAFAYDITNGTILAAFDAAGLSVERDTGITLVGDVGNSFNGTFIEVDDNNSKITITKQPIMPNLPTTNPAVAGALWNDGGTVKVSAG